MVMSPTSNHRRSDGAFMRCSSPEYIILRTVNGIVQKKLNSR